MFVLKFYVQNFRLWQNDVKGKIAMQRTFLCRPISISVAYRFSLALLICITNGLKK